jgi:GTP-binding protein
VTRAGLGELAAELLRRVPPRDETVELEELAGAADGEALAEHRVFRPAAERGFRVQQIGEGSYRVSGRGVERLVARYDLENEEAMAHLERRLRGIGVIHELESKGFQAGDAVEIAGVEFDLDPSV